MFRLISAEFKKMFLKPSMFIVTGILIALLGISAVNFKIPTQTTSSISFSGNTISEQWNDFNHSSSNYSKINLDVELNKAKQNIEVYLIDNPAKTEITNKQTEIKDNYTQFVSSLNPRKSETYIENKMLIFKNSFSELRDIWKNYTENSLNTYIFTTERSAQDFLATINAYLNAFEIPKNSKEDKYDLVLKNINNLKFHLLDNSISSIQYFSPNKEKLEKFNNEVFISYSNKLNELYNSMQEFVNTNGTSDDVNLKKEFKKMYNNYYYMNKSIISASQTKLNLLAFEPYSNSQVQKFQNYKNVHFYQMRETLTKSLYFLENNKFENSFDTPYSFDISSSTKVNAFDFMFYSIEIFTFIIIVFLMISASGAIAGEFTNGTMKQLAIRPIKRHKILTGKLIALFLFGLTLLSICSISSLIAGIILFGLPTNSVLIVLNSSVAFSVPHFIAMLFYLITVFIKICFFTIIAFSLSVLIRNLPTTISVSMLVYFLSLVFSAISVSEVKSPLLNLFVPFNTNLFKYFGGAFAGNSGGSLLSTFLYSPLLIQSNILTAILGMLVFSLLFLIPAYTVFKKKDI